MVVIHSSDRSRRGKVDYHVGSSAYLERARVLLEKHDPEFLFHAAFELRSGIEARLQADLEPHESIPKRGKKGYQLKKLKQLADQVSLPDDRVMRITYFRPDGKELGRLYHTPVTTALKKNGEKLGDLLHAQQTFRSSEDPWWKEVRALLNTTFEQLQRANLGELLGCMTLSQDGKEAKLHALLDPEVNESLAPAFVKGARLAFRVDHLDEYPAELLERLG